ncbi:hypothetical protein [Ammoniphilus sp. CFH 90114]|uniref:hypothetical protein n=1 Tax=Ammoniphilus sp. CFH 90114 TaxID=2493665 RepID=UPI00100DABD4|nr:hypothetical protein [Ammoniphilus sp. CFH 90114]RXT03807.1 hypothetical protein EIZ39_22775 [Ammoniphilus sp. CFH 90114]
MKKKRNPWLAMGLTLVYPGLGHGYLGEMGVGLLYITIHSFLLLVAMMSLGFLGLPALIFWIYAIVKVLIRADQINKEEVKPEFVSQGSANKSFIFTFLIGLIPFYVFPFQTYFSLYDRLPSEKREVQAYLQRSLEEKYGTSAEVYPVTYSWNAGDMDGTFSAQAKLSEYPMFSFQVTVSGKKSLKAPISDTFVNEFMKYQYGEKYRKKIGSDLEEASFSHSEIWVDGINPRVARMDLKELAKNPESYISIYINTVKFMDLTENNKEQLAQQIWSVVEPLKEEGISAISLNIDVFHPEQNTPSFNRKQSYNKKIANISVSKESHIRSAEDIVPLIEFRAK